MKLLWGLAAIQIGEALRVIIVRDDFDNKEDQRFVALINPRITRQEGGTTEEFEGCLSVKNYYTRVSRHRKIKLKAKTVDNKDIIVKAEGFLARVLQHEVDHLNGVMTVDRAHPRSEDSFRTLAEDGQLVKVSHEAIHAKGILLDD